MPPTPPPAPTTQDQEKAQAAAAAVRWVRDGMVLGLGTGTTAAHFIQQLGEKSAGRPESAGPGYLAGQRSASQAGGYPAAGAAPGPHLRPGRGRGR
ncbi:MAG: hypothetical protein WKG07_22890 [Hymenobacter sp.]